MAGYHLKEIPKGVYGEWSKVEEELAEYEDAKEQGSKIMMACELADIIGAINEFVYYSKDFSHAVKATEIKRYVLGEAGKLNLTLVDLLVMVKITQRAFKSGERK